ncbi:hypothetical protein VOLCADRAFT_99305 [Volvox carteri f. nagariensis]|uniref:Starch synthase, chloroplastic/amyloplastic n=1 Tax=Volvox carteri f. nagariensis TaxID=3068 RepID=D8UHG9_VOLCA|nr:uncharacterized protein VOLCADRAFT_99305 [Volvox carteri f. nagariensis]EFJ40823.1 hypothetical protein VOLCADRAFT_99305 [Volvox carteri f. nagariensis]|eukprot:XP_002958092.1 hypothetical protein VOLCADRAFT_99305 [Volvox carteri f. nagariensis]
MDLVRSPALLSARELRRMGSSECARRASRNAPRLVSYANWFQQQSTQAVTGDENSDAPARVSRPVVSTSAEEDFMRRARKMERRIAKLKRLQERLSQLKEESDLMQAYAEASADSDSDAEDAPLRAPAASASAEELRQWVAALVAKSAARAANAGQQGRGGSSTAATSSSNSSSSVSSTNGASSGSSIYRQSGSGGWQGDSGARPMPPPQQPQQQQRQPSAPPPTPGAPTMPPWGQATATATATGPPRQAGSSSSTKDSTTTTTTASTTTTSSTASTGAGSGGIGAVRRYTMVQLPSPGGQQPASAAAPVTSNAVLAAAPAEAEAAKPTAKASLLETPPPLPPPPLAQWRQQPHAGSTSAPPGPPVARPQGSQTAVSAATVMAENAPLAGPGPTTANWRTAASTSSPSPSPSKPSSSSSSSPSPSEPFYSVGAMSNETQRLSQPQPPQKQKQPSTTSTAAGSAAPSTPAAVPVPVPVPSPPRDPKAELRTTIFPESLTSTNPYTLYDMPLPPLPLRESWQTPAERRRADAAATAPRSGGGGAAAAAATAATALAERPRDLVFVTAEAAPWSKTGGLGDVMGSLPRALAARGHRVMVVSPRYLSPATEERYAGLTNTGVRATLDLGPPQSGGGGSHEVGFFHTHKDGVDWVFVDHMSYHRDGTPYGNAYGTYGDNLFRFALLCLAACEAPLLLHIGGHRRGTPPGLPYGQDVTFIANDWHAGLVPVYLAAKYRRHGVFKNARCVLALHNLAHQGAHPPNCFSSLGLPPDWYGALEWVLTPGAGGSGGGGHERKPTINILKVRQAHTARGIIGSLGGKGLCKAALQGALGLPVDPAAPLLGFIGRLDYQKGPDLVLQALPRLVAAGCQVVLLGSGAPDYEEAFRAAAAAFPANVRAHVGFSVPLSHRIVAASDILLMPSRFEPCGLNQLYAMRYGTVPVAHGTGGLLDTIDDVKPFWGEPARKEEEDLDELFASGLSWGRRTASRSADDPSTNNAEYYQPFQDYFGSSGRYGPVDEYDDDNEYGSEYDDDDSDLPAWRRGLGLGRSRDPGTGWTFAPATAEAMLDSVTAALAVYEHHPDKWRRIQLAGMRRDFSWERAARQWEAVLEGAHVAAAYCK